MNNIKQKKWWVTIVVVSILMTTVIFIIPLYFSHKAEQKRGLCYNNMFTIASRIRAYQQEHSGALPPNLLSIKASSPYIFKCPLHSKNVNKIKLSNVDKWSEYCYTPTKPIEIEINNEKTKIICFCSNGVLDGGAVNLIELGKNNHPLVRRPLIDEKGRKILQQFWENYKNTNPNPQTP